MEHNYDNGARALHDLVEMWENEAIQLKIPFSPFYWACMRTFMRYRFANLALVRRHTMGEPKTSEGGIQILRQFIRSELSCVVLGAMSDVRVTYVTERPRVHLLYKDLFVSHITTYMAHGQIPFIDTQVSHLCHHGECIDPRHLCVEPRTTNNNRSFYPDQWYLVHYSGTCCYCDYADDHL